MKEGDALLQSLQTGIGGLTQTEAEDRARRTGPNEVAQERQQGWFGRLLKIIRNPLVVLLTILSAVSYSMGDALAGTVMAAMVVLSVALRFLQESRADADAAKLKAMIHVTATVIRDGVAREMPLRDLVPGDVIKLSAGDMIPGDVRVLSCKDLFVSQGSLTGESFPVEKFHEAAKTAVSSPTEVNNTCFMGTSVESGTASAVVVTTEVHTYLGSMAGSITEERAPTSFDRGLNGFTWLMIRLMLVMVPLVFLINGFTKHDWKEAFFFAMAVAVGLTPEMLPMIVSVCLSKGAIAMSRKKVIVKRLNSIQNFGGMDVLCTDKTGTLTEDRVVLLRHCNVAGRETDEVLLDGYLISYFQTGLKNLLDLAVLNSQDFVKPDFHGKAQVDQYKKLDELPFDFTRRMMSVLVKDPEGKSILLTKGAPEEVFVQCSHFELEGKVSPMDPNLMVGLKQQYESLSSDGFRGLAVARKELPGKDACSKEDERDLVLKGYVAFLDPPKKTAGPAIEALHKHGVSAKNSYRGQPAHQPEGLRRRWPRRRPHAARRGCGETVRRRTGGRCRESHALRTPLAGSQAASHPRSPRQGARRRLHGRRHQRRTRLTSCGNRHLCGHRYGHRQRIGGSDPFGEGPHGARRRCGRGPEGLREYHQVHPDGG
jgi:Mg2+-importing ATPase